MLYLHVSNKVVPIAANILVYGYGKCKYVNAVRALGRLPSSAADVAACAAALLRRHLPLSAIRLAPSAKRHQAESHLHNVPPSCVFPASAKNFSEHSLVFTLDEVF